MIESTACAPASAANSNLVSRSLRVLHVIAPAAVGGLERVVCTLAQGQRFAGLDVRVAVVIDGEGQEHPVASELRRRDVEVATISVPSRMYQHERREVAAICARMAPDILHTHGYRTNLVDSVIGRRLSISRVSTFHGFTGGDLRNRFYEWLDRRTARGMDAVVAVSRTIGHDLTAAGVSAERVHVLPNAHAPRNNVLSRNAARAVLGLPQDRFVVGWVGRLTREKGADVLLEAMSLLRDEEISASFIGDGAERASLAARATASGAAVRWHGLMPDAARLLRAFDGFVLSSRTEGTPMVVFEAMDAGVPIVATRVGGVPDVLRPEDALLVERDCPGALADAIREIAQKKPAALARAASARRRLASEFAVEPWVERYTAVYRQAIHRGSR